jgi:hypothetical protein
MEDNPMMPAVVHAESNTLQDQRDDYLLHLRQIEAALDALGFEESDLEEGEAEIGFQIPRSLFDNELGGFSRELHELRLIIRAFSEISGNAGERIVIRQISTTDPLIYLMLGYLTITKIGNAVKWCLDQWKTLEDIRSLRASTANLKGVPAAQDMVSQFDHIIDQTIETRLRAEAKRLASEAKADASRENELANHLAKALEGLLARIERGMKVDIRVLPPPDSEDGAEDADVVTAFENLEAIRDDLVFPAVGNTEPILKISKQPEPQRRQRKSSESKKPN